MRVILIHFMVFSSLFSFSMDTLSVENDYTDEIYQLLYENYIDSIENTLTYEYNRIQLKNGVASILIPEGFKYLNGKDSDMILTDVWGNPPSEEPDQSLGMIIPEEDSPFSDSSYVINITYSTEGYIDDSDAKKLDYDELLETMISDTEESNEFRIPAGYPKIELVGWAAAPFYNSDSKKLHWAKELRFGDEEMTTLNYNIRILGRKGYLELNAIGSIDILNRVTASIDPVIESVNFNEGFRYEDFNPEYDKIAAYGISGLIAGKVLAKAGLFAKLGLILAKFWKVIAIGIIAIVAGMKKFFSRSS